MNKQQRRALEQLERANGELQPTDLVTAARSPDHPWHDRFEWDDAAAAQRQRLETAAIIIHEYKITVTIARRTVTINGYRKNPVRVSGVRSYKRTESIKAQRDQSRSALLNRATTIVGWLQNFVNDARYWEYNEIVNMGEAALEEMERAQTWLATPPSSGRRRGRGGGPPAEPPSPPT